MADGKLRRRVITESVIRFLLAWVAALGFIIFLGLYLSGGEITFCEANPVIRLVELVIYSGILGFAIYQLAGFIKGYWGVK